MASAPRHAIPPNRTRRNVLAALAVVLLLAAGTAVLWLTLRGGGDSDAATSDGDQAGTSTTASLSGTTTASTSDEAPTSSATSASVPSSTASVASTSAVVPPAATSSVSAPIAPPTPSVSPEQPNTPVPAPAAPPVDPPVDPTGADIPANAEPADPPAADPASSEALAAAIVSYYDEMPSDTDRAWALLTENYHTEIARTRQSFQRFWDRIETVTVCDATGTAPGTVEAILTYTLKNGSVSVERTRFNLVLDGGVLKIDSSSVLSARSG